MRSLPDGIQPHVSYGELRGLAASLGINVWSKRLPKGIAGCYDNEYEAIIIDRTMTYRRKRCALMHELFHWRYEDVLCGWRTDDRIEHRTRRHSASALVDTIEYATAENMYDGEIGLMAEELDVTKQVVEDYQRLVLDRRQHI